MKNENHLMKRNSGSKMQKKFLLLQAAEVGYLQEQLSR